MLAITIVFSLTFSAIPVANAEDNADCILSADFPAAAEGERVSIFIMQQGKSFSDLDNVTGDISGIVAHIATSTVQKTGYFVTSLSVKSQWLENECVIAAGGTVRAATLQTFVNGAQSAAPIVINGTAIEDNENDVEIILLKNGYTYDMYCADNQSGLIEKRTAQIDENGKYSESFSIAASLMADANVVIKQGDAVTERALDRSDVVMRLHVDADAPSGGNGSELHPFNTIAEARDYLRTIDHSAQRVHVLVHAGEYQTTAKTTFTAEDSGSEGYPVIYKAAGDGEVIFNGSVKLDFTQFTRVTDETMYNRLPESSRDSVRVMSLEGYGLDEDFLNLRANVTKSGSTALPLPAYLYFNDLSQTIARYPNADYHFIKRVDATITEEDEVTEDKDTEEDQGGTDSTATYTAFVYGETTSAPDRWETATDSAIICGPMAQEYAINWVGLKAVDTTNKIITFDRTLAIPSDSNTKENTCRWYAQNLIEELDIPGEYFIDPSEMKLYYYPTRRFTADDTLEIASFNDYFISISGAKYLELEGISFRHSRSDGIYITNSDYVTVRSCDMLNIGGVGVQLSGRNCVVEGCNLRETAHFGIRLSGGGSRSTYTYSNNAVRNNHLYKCGRLGRHMYTYAIDMGRSGGSTIGDVVENNVIHGIAQGHGILFGGLENKILSNEIYNVGMDMADGGAIYCGRKLNEWGNVVQYNYIHDYAQTFESRYATVGIYFDDWESGQSALDNILVPNQKNYRVQTSISVGAYNTFERNITVNSRRGISISDRGSGIHETAYITLSPDHSYSTEAVRTKWPEMASLWNDYYADAENWAKVKFPVINNVIRNNLSFNVKGSGSWSTINIDSNVSANGTVENNPYTADNTTYTVVNSGGETINVFADPTNHDWRLTKEAIAHYNLPEDMINVDNFQMESIGITDTDVFDLSKGAGGRFNLIYPASGQNLDTAEGAFLRWEEAINADKYSYVVASDAELTDVIEEGETYYPYAALSELEEGETYYYKVTAMNTSRQFGDEWDNESGVTMFTVAVDNSTLKMNDVQVLSGEKEIESLDGVSSFDVKMSIVNQEEAAISYVTLIGLFDSEDRLKEIRTFNGYNGDGSYVIASTVEGAEEGDKVSIFVMKEGKGIDDLKESAGGDVSEIVAYVKTTRVDEDGFFTELLPAVASDSAGVTCVIACNGEMQEGTLSAFVTDDTVSTQSAVRTFEFTLSDAAQSSDYIRCFILKDFGTLRPLARVVEKFRQN